MKSKRLQHVQDLHKLKIDKTLASTKEGKWAQSPIPWQATFHYWSLLGQGKSALFNRVAQGIWRHTLGQAPCLDGFANRSLTSYYFVTLLFVCLFSRERKNMKLDGQEERRIWEELGTGKNRIKIYFMKFSENTLKKMVHWIKVLAT